MIKTEPPPAPIETLSPVTPKPTAPPIKKLIPAGVAALALIAVFAFAMAPRASKAERAAWTDAKSAHSRAAYEAYLRAFEEGSFADEAKKRIAEIRAKGAAAWEAARASDSADAYRNFLKEYPDDSDHASLAETRLAEVVAEESAWQEARAKATEKAFTSFIKAYPQSRFAEEAQRSLASLREAKRAAEAARALDTAYRSATNRKTRDAYETFLATFGDSQYATIVRAKLASCRTERSGGDVLQNELPLSVSTRREGRNHNAACGEAQSVAAAELESRCRSQGGRAQEAPRFQLVREGQSGGDGLAAGMGIAGAAIGLFGSKNEKTNEVAEAFGRAARAVPTSSLACTAEGMMVCLVESRSPPVEREVCD